MNYQRRFTKLNSGLLTNIIRSSILFFFLSASVAAEMNTKFEILSCQDTIAVYPGDSVLVLAHCFVISGTERVRSESKLTQHYRLEPISGRIFLLDPVETVQIFVVSYEYLSRPFQARVGPTLAALPRLEDLPETNESSGIETSGISFDNELPLVTDGTLFRGISISPSSGISLNGGLQLNLQGQLSENMTVTGTLSDQNTPIQPEGNTQTLDEIDKVYLEVKHPSATIVAGDIDMQLNQGQFLNVSRRLEGLNMQLSGKKTETGLTIASTKGKYHRMEFKGLDRNQGPYPLFSEIGSRNIIIMASSEQVWLDGQKMERGENNDYTIDYSRGEITFTPGRVIDSNSRIYIEFEYSDLVYPRQIASTSLRRVLGDGRSSASFTWIRENDNLNLPLIYSLNDKERDRLKELGENEVKMMSAVKDSNGDYIKEPSDDGSDDSIFVYIREMEKNKDSVYYQVTFHNVGPHGEYTRKVTTSGEIYFEYMDVSYRDGYSDLYVPWRAVRSPESHQIFNLTTDFYLGDSTRAAVNLAGSIRDRNLLSSLNDKNNTGYARRLELSHNRKLSGNLGRILVTAYTQGLGESFFTLQRDRSVEFNREWNLVQDTEKYSKSRGISQRLSEVIIHHRIGKRNSSAFSIGSYSDLFQHAARWQGTTSLFFHWIPELNIDMTGVTRRNGSTQPEDQGEKDRKVKSSWQRERFSAQFLPGRFHPYIRFLHEERTSEFKFYETGGGLFTEGNRVRTHVGLLRRVDYDYDSTTVDWREQSESWLGEMDLKGRWRSGYRVHFLFKQRIKSYTHQRGDQQYGLARGSLGYHPRRGNVRANVDFKLEQTLFQHKIVVYDSVGPGLGQYRYDSNYNQYFIDPNGSFLATHIPSGKKIPATHITVGFKFFYDFRKTPYLLLRNITWRMYGNTDYNGSNFTLNTLYYPSLSTEGLHRSRVNFQQDLSYISRHSRRRIRISTFFHREILGKKTPETSERFKRKYSASIEEPISSSVTVVMDASVEKSDISSFIATRDRRMNGWLLASGLRWRLSKFFEAGGDLRVGYDEGSNAYERFVIRLTGSGLHIQLFPQRGGRLRASIDYYNVVPESPLQVLLPPEAALGLQAGKTYRAGLTALLVLGKNISANANFSYLLDPIHDGIILFTGEVRATF